MIRRSLLSGLIVSLLAALTLGAQTPAPPTTPPALPTLPTPTPAVVTSAPVARGNDFFQQNVVYGKGVDVDLHADLAWPKNATAPMPAIIHIHGGGWIAGDKRWDAGLAGFANHGYFAASIEYRLDNVAKWPAQIQDCKCAVRWLRANAAKYNVDPNRIGVIGESAGGHLVACLDTMTDPKLEGDGGWPGVSSAVQAVVDFYGPTDFLTPDIYTEEAKRLTMGLFGVPRDQNPDLWKSASPVFFVAAGDPPVLMVHGDADPLVPLAQSQVFAAALTKAGVPHQLLVIKNGRHGLGSINGLKIDPPWSVINQTVLDFFAKNLAQK
jgi:acetyl esterase/lipase